LCHSLLVKTVPSPPRSKSREIILQPLKEEQQGHGIEEPRGSEALQQSSLENITSYSLLFHWWLPASLKSSSSLF
jgi:hypothetical protein